MDNCSRLESIIINNHRKILDDIQIYVQLEDIDMLYYQVGLRKRNYGVTFYATEQFIESPELMDNVLLTKINELEGLNENN